jgi:hypothetical protein
VGVGVGAGAGAGAGATFLGSERVAFLTGGADAAGAAELVSATTTGLLDVTAKGAAVTTETGACGTNAAGRASDATVEVTSTGLPVLPSTYAREMARVTTTKAPTSMNHIGAERFAGACCTTLSPAVADKVVARLAMASVGPPTSIGPDLADRLVVEIETEMSASIIDGIFERTEVKGME